MTGGNPACSQILYHAGLRQEVEVIGQYYSFSMSYGRSGTIRMRSHTLVMYSGESEATTWLYFVFRELMSGVLN